MSLIIRVRGLVLLLFALSAPFALFSAGGTQDEQKARVQRIEDAVLAPCCYTEPVSHHQSEIAVKMRIEIATWVAAGRTDQEILDTYVQRYGAKVLVDPRTIPGSWTPWVPWLTLILGAVFALWLLRRWRADPAPDSDDRNLPDFEDEESQL
jgi:cytochrome c-type biogenesis protein CcmH